MFFLGLFNAVFAMGVTTAMIYCLVVGDYLIAFILACSLTLNIYLDVRRINHGDY